MQALCVANNAPQPSPRARSLSWLPFVVLSAILAIVAGYARGGIFDQPDSGYYLLIAQGKIAAVPQPFSARQLFPLLARAASPLLHDDIHAAFLVEGIFSLLTVLALSGFILTRAGVPAVLLAAVGGMAFWSTLFNGLALPDLGYAALLALLLLLLDQQRFWLAALLLLPLALARESTALTLLCLLAAGWQRARLCHALTAIAATIAGMSLVKGLAAGGLPNREQLPPLLYLVGKAPWNFMKNVVGLPLWNNLNCNNCTTPQSQFHVPLGGMQAIGFCAFDPLLPLATIAQALTCFGFLPLLLLFLWRRDPHLLHSASILLRFCALYGLVSFLLAPVLGSSVLRLYGYAWPLFAVATPLLALRAFSLQPRPALLFLLLHLGLCWLPLWHPLRPFALANALFLVLLSALAWAAGWSLLSRCASNLAQENTPALC